MPPPHTSFETNEELSKSPFDISGSSDEASPGKKKDHNMGQRPCVGDVLSSSRHTQVTPVASNWIGDISALDSLDPFLTRIGPETFPDPLDFDLREEGDLHISANTSFLSGVASSPNEMLMDGLEIDLEMAPMEFAAENSHNADHLHEISAQWRPSPKSSATISTRDCTTTDVDMEWPLFNPISMLNTPTSPASQELPRAEKSEWASRMHERLQMNAPIASAQRNDQASVSSAADMMYDRRSTSPRFCQCMQKVMVLYEEVETKRNGDVVSSTEFRLSRQDSVLTQCMRLIGCTDCRRMSGFITLLITICDRLMSLFQKTSADCLDKLQHHQQWQRRPATCNSLEMELSDNDEVAGEEAEVFVGGYRIESPQDQYCLVLAAIELQLKRFRGFWMRLKDISRKSECERHKSMLGPIDNGLRDVLAKLRQARNDALGERLTNL